MITSKYLTKIILFWILNREIHQYINKIILLSFLYHIRTITSNYIRKIILYTQYPSLRPGASLTETGFYHFTGAIPSLRADAFSLTCFTVFESFKPGAIPTLCPGAFFPYRELATPVLVRAFSLS